MQAEAEPLASDPTKFLVRFKVRRRGSPTVDSRRADALVSQFRFAWVPSQGEPWFSQVIGGTPYVARCWLGSSSVPLTSPQPGSSSSAPILPPLARLPRRAAPHRGSPVAIDEPRAHLRRGGGAVCAPRVDLPHLLGRLDERLRGGHRLLRRALLQLLPGKYFFSYSAIYFRC